MVHLRYFLHIGLKRTPRDNLLALAFAACPDLHHDRRDLVDVLDLNARMIG